MYTFSTLLLRELIGNYNHLIMLLVEICGPWGKRLFPKNSLNREIFYLCRVFMKIFHEFMEFLPRPSQALLMTSRHCPVFITVGILVSRLVHLLEQTVK